MKTILAVILAAGLGAIAATLIVSQRAADQHATQLAEQQAAWQAERAELEAALERAKARRAPTSLAPAAPVAAIPALRLSPAQIIARLQQIRLAPDKSPTRGLRQAVYFLEELIATGPAALPAIREFLARNEDLNWDASWFTQGKGARDRLPGDFILPPSLRFGLFDALKQIGGAEVETILADALGVSKRGVEVAYLTRVLQEMAPNKYRDRALSVARDLLAASFSPNSNSPIERNHRDHLYNVLAFYRDGSYAPAAQNQLVSGDGQVDRSALRYLQQTLGAQAVTVAAQAYQDPRLTNSAVKEPLARLALSFVGADSQANQMYQMAINDVSMPKNNRRELIEDLNQDGFADPKNLTANDLPLIQNRIALIEQLAPSALDQVNAAAFQEAYKDLLKMREQVTQPPAATKPGKP